MCILISEKPSEKEGLRLHSLNFFWIMSTVLQPLFSHSELFKYLCDQRLNYKSKCTCSSQKSTVLQLHLQFLSFLLYLICWMNVIRVSSEFKSKLFPPCLYSSSLLLTCPWEHKTRFQQHARFVKLSIFSTLSVFCNSYTGQSTIHFAT